MKQILKYPRTPHLEGSRLQRGDEDLAVVPLGDLAGLPLVIEEKLDGANCGISFDSEGTLLLQSRGHLLSGGPRERQFDLFKRWANHHRAALWKVLGPKFVMYGEWLYARHMIAYDRLPHYFMEFDVLDRDRGEFLTTPQRRNLLGGSPVISVPVLSSGQPKTKTVETLLGPSQCSSSEWVEGLYIKWEDDGKVLGRYKYVRSSFLQAVEDAGEHWMDRPIEPNLLRPGVDIFQS
jgi:hypothetical protein